jgi:hypothetical protein
LSVAALPIFKPLKKDKERVDAKMKIFVIDFLLKINIPSKIHPFVIFHRKKSFMQKKLYIEKGGVFLKREKS